MWEEGSVRKRVCVLACERGRVCVCVCKRERVCVGVGVCERVCVLDRDSVCLCECV